MPEIISRKEAKARGLIKYFTGKACLYGHVNDRYVRTGTCCKCCIEKSLRLYRKNKALDPEKRRKYASNYYIANREKIKERIKRLRGKPCKHGHLERYAISGQCVECARSRALNYRKTPEGRAKRNMTRQQYLLSPEGREAERIRKREYKRKHREQDRASNKKQTMRRQAAMRALRELGIEF